MREILSAFQGEIFSSFCIAVKILINGKMSIGIWKHLDAFGHLCYICDRELCQMPLKPVLPNNLEDFLWL